MKAVFSSKTKRQITSPEHIAFISPSRSVHLIQITAQTRGEKEIGKTDDEDLRIEIDHQKFPQLTNSQRYLDSPASFSGGMQKGKPKTVFFLLWLEAGQHLLSFIPDISAQLLEVSIFADLLAENEETLELPLHLQAEDGDRRPWLTFVLIEASLTSFTTNLTLKRRSLDSDDVKVIIDGQVKRNDGSKLHKLWYLAASLLQGENQIISFDPNTPFGLHYLEFWTDRMPLLNSISFSGLHFKIPPFKPPETIQEKITAYAKEYGFEAKMMLRLAKRESQFNPKEISSMNAKGLFQLTPDTLAQIENLGYKVDDVFDTDQNIKGGLIYFNWLYQQYKNHGDDMRKTLAAWSRGPSRVPKSKPLDWEELPDETKKLINDVLGDYDF